ncbi:hypothetical protein ACROYT_G021282 [Oculina patagonica]
MPTPKASVEKVPLRHFKRALRWMSLKIPREEDKCTFRSKEKCGKQLHVRWSRNETVLFVWRLGVGPLLQGAARTPTFPACGWNLWI